MNAEKTTLLCIVAHPDDETMICGGTLAALAERGIEIHVLCATRGEGGELGEPPVCSREDLGRVREAEMRCACRTLGVRQVGFLDYEDPLVGPDNGLSAFAEDEEELRDHLLAHLRRTRPDIVITHGRDGEYGHPAHKLLHRAAWSAFQGMVAERDDRVFFYTMAAAIPGREDRLFNDSEPADLVFELEDKSWLDTKEAAALCHITQHALFKRRRKAKTVRQVLRRSEGLYRYWPLDGPDATGLSGEQKPQDDSLPITAG
jgi:LmbE family N-acetylglucosaminyl deacetylase